MQSDKRDGGVQVQVVNARLKEEPTNQGTLTAEGAEDTKEKAFERKARRMKQTGNSQSGPFPY